MAVKVKKCRSVKHSSIGGCRSPRCPEGKYIKAALDKAIDKHSFEEFFKVKEDLRISHFTDSFDNKGWQGVYIQNTTLDYSKKVTLPYDRAGIKEQVEAVDKNILPSFDTVKDLESWARDTYGDVLKYDLREYNRENDHHGLNIPRISVAFIVVDSDARGLGVSQHIRRTLKKYADEHGAILSGTATSAGDGSFDRDDPDYKVKALKHRQRLEGSYVRNGYMRNPCFYPYSSNDELTGEPFEYDYEGAAVFTEEAELMLKKAGEWLRFPNNAIPKKMLKQEPQPQEK